MNALQNAATNRLREKLGPKEEEPVAAEPEVEEAEEPAEVAESVEEAEAAVTPEEPAEETAEAEEPKEEDAEMTPRERALLRELSRVKQLNRAAVVEPKLGGIVPNAEDEAPKAKITPALAAVYTAWRDEALEEFVEKHPKYKTDPKLWERFSREYSELVPEIVHAERNKIPVTKALFKERIRKVHRSLGEDVSNEREEGKKELLKAQSAAAIMASGASKGSMPGAKAAPKKTLFPRNASGFDAWKTK